MALALRMPHNSSVVDSLLQPQPYRTGNRRRLPPAILANLAWATDANNVAFRCLKEDPSPIKKDIGVKVPWPKGWDIPVLPSEVGGFPGASCLG